MAVEARRGAEPARAPSIANSVSLMSRAGRLMTYDGSAFRWRCTRKPRSRKWPRAALHSGLSQGSRSRSGTEVGGGGMSAWWSACCDLYWSRQRCSSARLGWQASRRIPKRRRWMHRRANVCVALSRACRWHGPSPLLASTSIFALCHTGSTTESATDVHGGCDAPDSLVHYLHCLPLRFVSWSF